MKLSENKILITGGASGIGLGLALRFLQENNEVIICGRSEERLHEAVLKNPALITRRCDLTSEAERIDLFKWISEDHPDLTVLINNAGIQNWMDISDDDFFSKAQREVEVNIIAPLQLSSLFLKLPALATIMNVTSGLSFSPLATVPVYSATKAFFHSFTLSLRHLLRHKNIEVIEIIPPALNTDLGGKGLHDFAPAVSDFIDAVFKQLKENRKELTFGFSEHMSSIGSAELNAAFKQMNPVT